MKRRLDRLMDRLMDRFLDHDADHVLDRGDFAISLAMLTAAPKAKPKQSRVDHAARFAIEKALQQRRYCNAFALWRTCRDKICRRQGACRGDANACLQRVLGQKPHQVPHDVQWRVRPAILEATPVNIGAPERKARQCMPLDLYAVGSSQ